LKKVAFFIVVLLVVFPSPSFAKSWWQKIIERMMSEGIVRTDSGFDDAAATKMAYDAYVIAPKSFTAKYSFTDFNMFPKAEEASVSADVKKGKYGPVSFSGDVLEIISKGNSLSKRKSLVLDRASRYKLDAQARIASYVARAEKIREEAKNMPDFDIDGISGRSLEVVAGEHSELMETLADNMALKLHVNELLALKTALTGEMAILGTEKYARAVAGSLDRYIEIYDMAKVR